MAVLEAGKPPVQIDWWFTDSDLEVGLRHHWGSLNWSRPLHPPGALGEVPGAARTWRDGSRPPGACEDSGLTVGCSDNRLSLTAKADLTHAQGGFGLDLAYDPASQWWTGSTDVSGDPLITHFGCDVFCNALTADTFAWYAWFHVTRAVDGGSASDLAAYDQVQPGPPEDTISFVDGNMFPGTYYPLTLTVGIPNV